MSVSGCKICKFEVKKIFSGLILNKHEVDYFYCKNCYFLCTENPYWLKEAYLEPISVLDTGVMHRNNMLARHITVLLYFLFDHKNKFLDYAGGFGFFTRLMRDVGFDFYWDDIYTQNLVARGFEYTAKTVVECMTVLECFEHLVDPIEEIAQMIAISRNILFTTELLPSVVPGYGKWWYYSHEAGQHIAFYSYKTLEYIAKKNNLFLVSYKNFHLFSEKKVSTLLFKSLIEWTNFGLYTFCSKKLKSKTVSDMLLMKQRKKIENVKNLIEVSCGL